MTNLNEETLKYYREVNDQIQDGGSTKVSNIGMPGGTIRTQTADVTASRQRFHFDPPIKAMVVTARYTAADAATDDAVLITVGAPSTPVADSWLDENNIAPRITLIGGEKEEVYFNGSLVSDVDFIGVGAGVALRISVGGIS